MRIAYLDVVSEYVVVADFQAWDTGPFAFSLLDVQQVILAGVSHLPQLVQFFVDTLPDDFAPSVEQGRGIVVDLPLYPVADDSTQVQSVADGLQYRFGAFGTELFDRPPWLSGPLSAVPPRGGDSAYGHLRDDAFYVADPCNLLFDLFLHLRGLEKVFYRRQPVVDGFYLFEGEDDPAAQHPGAHRAGGTVYHIEQAFPAFVDRFQQLQAVGRDLSMRT